MNGEEFEEHDKGESPEELESLTLRSAELHGKLGTNEPLLVKEELADESSPPVVVHEPNSITSEPAKWSPLSSKVRFHKIDDSSLVQLESDDEDESLLPSTHAASAQQANQQLALQLERDGYELDQVPDDENIDLLFPSNYLHRQACTCCQAVSVSCVIS